MYHLPSTAFAPIKIIMFLSLLLWATYSNALQLDIHLKLQPTSCLHRTATIANQNLHQHSSFEKINFHISQPHITLYLTEFRHDSINTLVDGLYKLDLNHQLVDINDTMVSGAYATYSVQNTRSLQQLSDEIVRNCSQYIVANQTVPNWVYDLPEPQRTKKINYVHQYGSPNVLDEFEPHLTVGYDEEASEEDRRIILEKILSDDSDSCREDSVWEIGVGVVGEMGTVLWDMTVISLKSDEFIRSTNSGSAHKIQRLH